MIKGILATPPRETCAADIAEKLALNEELTDYLKEIDYQAEYMEVLRKETQHETSLKGCVELFRGWENDKIVNIVTYRDVAHRNLFTGKISPTLSTPWVQFMDDSLAAFLDAEYVQQ